MDKPIFPKKKKIWNRLRSQFLLSNPFILTSDSFNCRRKLGGQTVAADGLLDVGGGMERGGKMQKDGAHVGAMSESGN